jgi:ABC-type multidrug transport system fused ATPase/permease subunit
MPTTVKELNDTIKGIIDDLTKYTTSISTSYNNMSSRSGSLNSIVENDVSTQSTIKQMEEETEMTNRKFVEAEHKFKVSGGKSRKQTLQEFIILFFFVAYALFTVSLVVYYRSLGRSVAKILGLMAFILLIIVGIIVRYA